MQKIILYLFLKAGVVRFAVIISAILFLSNPCKTETIKIPADYETIQQGINNAEHGDTVLVSPGIYYENINFNGKNIVLASLFITTDDTSFISQTVIDGNRQGTVVTFESGEDSTAVLTGFTITNGFIEGTPEQPFLNGMETRCSIFQKMTISVLLRIWERSSLILPSA